MKRRILSITAILIVVLSILSCDSSIKRIEEGNINYNIYPYLEFELSPDSTYYIAYVVNGAKLTTVSIPGEKHTDYGAMPVRVFGGFRNPEDAVNLETVILDKGIKEITEGALDYAQLIKRVETRGEDGTSLWANLPILNRDGFHFLGWKTGDGKFVENGMAVDSRYPIAEPIFEEHRYIYYEGKEATCTEKGWNEYGVCSVCGESTYEEIPPLGHSLRHIDRIEPTCREEGVIEHYLCTRCGEKFTDIECLRPIDDVTIPKTSHALYHVEAKEATCSEEGNIEHYRCYFCNGYFLDEEGSEEVSQGYVTITVSSHVPDGNGWHSNQRNHYHECKWCHEAIDVETHISDGGTVKVHPTLHDPGIMEYRCTACDNTWEEYIPEGDHIPVFKETVDPTCTERGYDLFICGNEDCNAEVKDNYTDPLGHDALYIEKVYATCTEDGTKAHYECSRCGGLFWNREATEEIGSSDLIIPRTGHSFNVEIWEKDDNTHWHPCTNTDQNTGERCDAKDNESRHVFNKEIVSASTLKQTANCTEKAQYWKNCECGQISASEWFEYGEPLGHKIIIHQSALAATCEEVGYKEYWYCDRCKKYFSDSSFSQETTLEERTIPVLGHDWQWRNDPSQHWKECSRCHETISESYGSHNYLTQNGITKCTVCGYVVVTGEGGFTPIVIDKRPEGHLEYVKAGKQYTFTLIDDKPEDNLIERVQWYLDGRLEKTEEGDGPYTFTFNAPYPMTYKVMCVFSNEDGKGSDTVVVNGGQ